METTHGAGTYDEDAFSLPEAAALKAVNNAGQGFCKGGLLP